MGLHYYLKSLFAVFVLVGLLLLTWHKATEIVREVADFQTITSQAKPTDLKSMQRQATKEAGLRVEMHNTGWKDTKTDTYDTIRTAKVEKAKSTTPAAFTSTESLTTPDFKDSPTTEIDSKQAFKSLSSTPSTMSLLTTTTTTGETKPRRTPGTFTALTTSLSNEHDTTEESNQEYEKSSKEKHHVAFLKVHKTGSSTVQNIFLRFGYSRNLTFILAHDDTEKAETKYPNMISYSNSLNENNIVPPPDGRHFELLCCHVIYNRMQFEKYLPADTAYIGLVREPVARLESSFRYFNLYPNVSLTDFAANPFRYDRGFHSMSNNRMSFEFGFPLNLFPNSKVMPGNLQEEINKYIDKLINEFDLIMINDRMDESLVLMKRILNWHIKDIMYMKQLVARQETRRFTDTDIKNLKSHLYLDYALYQAAMIEFDKKIEKLGDDFTEEVDHFKQEKDKIQVFCNKHGTGEDVLSLEKTKWDTAYHVTKQDCGLYTKFEIKFIQDIRMKQYGRLGI